MDERAALDLLDERLPPIMESERTRLDARVRVRWHDYPFGSGQGDEIGLRAGLRPMLRELLPEGRIDDSIARFERLGFACERADFTYGRTKGGWLRDPEPSGSPDARTPLFVGRDRGALREAAIAEVTRTDEANVALGRLLGYPRCCVHAFVQTSRERRAPELIAAALERTTGRPHPRLNGLDLAVFHFLSWSPCSFECEPSLRYADALARVVAKVHPTFVASIDRALSRTRLVLTHEIQLSIEGTWEADALHVTRVDATACDRHPRSDHDAREADLTARALALIEGARTLTTSYGRLVIDRGARVLELPPPLPMLIPFG